MIFNNLFCDSFFSFFSYHVQAYIQYVKECVNSSLEGCTHLDTQLVQGSVPVLVVSQLRLAQTGSDQFGQANTSSPSENTWVPTLKTNLVSQPDSVGGQVNIYIQYVEHKKKKFTSWYSLVSQLFTRQRTYYSRCLWYVERL